MSEFLNAALSLYDLGFSVFPLLPRDKHPNATLLPLDGDGKPTWKPYQTERATLDQIREWWKRSPNANIAIATGAVSGCFVTDVDGLDGVAELNKRSKMPRTPVSKTSSGWHIVLKHPGFAVPNRVKFLPGLDIRGDGGYIVAPPSIHPSGAAYRWLVEPGQAAWGDAPAWELELLKPHEVKPRPPIDHIAPHGEKVDTARAALDAVSPSRRDNYEDWYQVGMTLQELGSDGLYLWDAWSALSDKYKPGECQRKWDSFRGSGLTLASLYHMADQDSGTGWRPVKIDLTPPIIVSNENGKPSHLLSGERGALYRNTDRVTAILIDAAANAGPTFDIPYLVCCAEFHGISASAVYKAVNRLSVVFLHCGAYIEEYTIQENLDHGKDSICATVEECLSDLEARRVGRPATMYRLADRATLHAWILKQAIPKIVKETFTKKLGIAAPVQVAFLEELGLDEFEAAAKAKELERLYGRALSEQPGARQAMQDVRKRVRTLKAQLASSPDAPIPAGVMLDNRPNMLAAALRALMGVLGKAFQITQEKLCGLIGCRKNELASVCRAVGLVVDRHVYEDRPAVNEPAVLRVPRKYDPEVGGFPDRVISSYDKRGMGFSSPTLERWVHKQFMQVKAQVFIRYRLANWYRLAEPELVTEPIEIPEPPKVLAVQPELIPVERPAPFVPWLRALVMFRFAARLLNALVMAWSVAKEAAWHLRQHADRIVPYAEAWLNKLVSVATGQPKFAKTLSKVKTEIAIQMSFDLLLENEAYWKPSTLTSTPFDNGAGSCAPQSPPESRAPGNTSYTSPSPTSGPTCTTAPPLSPPMENITMNANALALEGT